MDAGRQGDRRDPRQVGLYREDIRQVHGQRVVHSFIEAPGRTGGGGQEDEVVVVQDLHGGVAYEAARLLGFAVVGVVVARAEHEGAQHDPAFHFGAEAFRAGAGIGLQEVAGIGAAVAVADAVVAREVG